MEERLTVNISRRRGEIMLGEDSQPSFFIYKARVGVDLGETLHYSQMIQNRLDEEKIRIAYYLQITPTYADEQKENKKVYPN